MGDWSLDESHWCPASLVDEQHLQNSIPASTDSSLPASKNSSLPWRMAPSIEEWFLEEQFPPFLIDDDMDENISPVENPIFVILTKNTSLQHCV